MVSRARFRAAAMLALKGVAGGGERDACAGRVTRLAPRGPSGQDGEGGRAKGAALPAAAAAAPPSCSADGPGGGGGGPSCPAGAPVEAAAAAALSAGGLVALPTDTVYGLACLAQDSRALAALYRLKGRAGAKPLAVCLPDLPLVHRYCKVRVPEELLRDLLPGPVTVVLERSEALNQDLNPFTPLVGVRIPGHWFVREVARICAAPLALTSANLSNKSSSLTVSEFQELWPHLALVVDGGPIGDVQSPECRLGSTVVDLSVPGKFKVIRPGCALTRTMDILVNKYGLTSDLPSS